jgi:outer membrane protein OmpA-like peptidoglycan-associated protein
MKKITIVCITLIFFGLSSFTRSDKKTIFVETNFPRFYFKVNSTDYYNTVPGLQSESSDSTFNGLLEADSLNPTIVFEIVGNADFTEKKAYDLGLKRAEKIKSEMVKRGAHPNRWLISSYGDTRPMCPKNQIDAETDPTEKDKMHLMNRRVVFKRVTPMQTKEEQLRKEINEATKK